MVWHWLTAPNRRCPLIKSRQLARYRSFQPLVETLEQRTVLSTLFGLTTNNFILRFDSATPGTIDKAVYISGLQSGEVIQGIDFRPLTGQLYAIGITEGPGANDAVGRVYIVNLTTGVATAKATGAAPLDIMLADNADYGLDFNPASGGLRLVNSAGQNLRLNPNTGLLTAIDSNLAFTAGDANAGDSPHVAGVAYDQNFSGTPTTTLFGIDIDKNVLVRQGGVNGAPPPTNASPNQGELTTIGGLGINVDAGAVGFDTQINLGTGASRAYATLTDAATGLTGLFTVNLATGVATLVGSIGNGATPIAGLAIAPTTLLAVGANSGVPQVRVLETSGAERFSFLAYASTTGGVRVAVGDVNRDGVPDIITAPGSGAAAQIKAFSGIDGSLLASFFAFAITFKGGATVAAGDLNADGFDDVIVGAGSGGGGRVKAFNLQGGVSELKNFQAYGASYTGGVNVAAGDVNFDGRADIITGPGAGFARPVKVFSGLDNSVLFNFFAFSTTYTGGVFVAAGDIDGDGRVDLIAGRQGGLSTVRTFNVAGASPIQTNSFLAYGTIGGVRVAAGDVDGDGRAEIITAPGPGIAKKVRALDGLSLAEVDAFFAFTASFTGGGFVAAGRG